MEDKKTIAIVSYLTLIGWVVALVMHQNNKSSLGAFHLRQALGLFLTWIALWIVGLMLAIIPFIGWLIMVIILPLGGIGILIFLILGIISAANEEEKPLPIVGDFYQKLLKGIN